MLEFTTLKHLPNDVKYTKGSEVFLRNMLSKYIPIFRCPTKELTSKLPQDICAEIMDITVMPDWVRAGNRPVRWGDVIAIGDDDYMLLPSKDIAGHAIPRWPEVNAVRQPKGDA